MTTTIRMTIQTRGPEPYCTVQKGPDPFAQNSCKRVRGPFSTKLDLFAQITTLSMTVVGNIRGEVNQGKLFTQKF